VHIASPLARIVPDGPPFPTEWSNKGTYFSVALVRAATRWPGSLRGGLQLLEKSRGIDDHSDAELLQVEQVQVERD